MLVHKAKTAVLLAHEIICRLNGERPSVYSTEESIKILVDGQGSLSRFGDGEFNLILGKSLAFQPYTKELGSRLREVLESAGVNEPGHYVAIPRAMATTKGLTCSSSRFWLAHSAYVREGVYPSLDMGHTYMDAQMSRLYVNRSDKSLSLGYIEMWKRLWGGRRVLIAEGEKSRFGIGNDLLADASCIGRIICPAEDAWASHNEIEEAIVAAAPNFDLVLLVLGPTATVMAYDLWKRGVRAIDSGNMDMEYEWLLCGVTVQTAIPGKYTIEAKGGTSSERDAPQEYLAQVLKRID